VGILRRRRPRAEPEASRPTARIAALTADNARLAERCRALEERLALLDELPLPPEPLRVRIGPWPDPDHFLGVGRKIFWDVKRALSLAGRDLDSFRAILDFGCGCGRVLRYFRSLAPGRDLQATDLDPEAVAWCQEHLGSFATVVLCGEDPPLPYADARFDLVLAISVFSHLPAERQFAWLAELSRVTRPGGLLVASVHGEALLDAPEHAETREALRREGLLYLRGPATAGLPDYYRSTYHTREYVQRAWKPYFELVHHLERGVNNQQDALVCRRPGA
jgi:SAM-dependent methyltransferase